MAFTAADEYLTHQTPYTFDRVFTSDRNFYDRYFFSGYRRDGEIYFALAMGVYPNLGVMDAAFSVVQGGKQYFVRASRALGSDRMDMKVGPISVSVVEPLRKVRIRVAKNSWGITADLVFDARSLPNEEPHFNRLARNVPVMDYTRMTQHGAWSGKFACDGKAYDLASDTWWGIRDHSWGIRSVGGRDPRGAPMTEMPQFFWNWAPANFEDLCTLYTVSEAGDGSRWHESGAIMKPYPEAAEEAAAVAHQLRFQKGTRWIEGATITLNPAKGKALELEFKPLYSFLMKGVGYGDPKWGHGMWVGPNETDGGLYDLSLEPPMANLHVQQVSQVTAGRKKGIGIFEIIVMGPHAPYGFKDLMDPAR